MDCFEKGKTHYDGKNGGRNGNNNIVWKSEDK
jgi:hypothetical protein